MECNVEILHHFFSSLLNLLNLFSNVGLFSIFPFVSVLILLISDLPSVSLDVHFSFRGLPHFFSPIYAFQFTIWEFHLESVWCYNVAALSLITIILIAALIHMFFCFSSVFYVTFVFLWFFVVLPIYVNFS